MTKPKNIPKLPVQSWKDLKLWMKKWEWMTACSKTHKKTHGHHGHHGIPCVSTSEPPEHCRLQEERAEALKRSWATIAVSGVSDLGGMSRNMVSLHDSNWMSNMVKASTLEGIQFYGFNSGWRGKTVEAIKQRSSKVGHVVPWLIPLLWRSAPIHASWSSSRNDLHMAESRLVSWGLRVRHPWSFFVCRGLGSNMTNTLWAIGAPLVGSFISASNSTLLFELGTNNKPHQATNSWS